MSKEYKRQRGYVYLGRYYDNLGRAIIDDVLTDKKIGYTDDYLKREQDLDGAQSFLKYVILKAYEVDNPEHFEKSYLHKFFEDRRIRYTASHGGKRHPEWFRDDDDTLTDEFTEYVESYTDEFNVVEVKANETIKPANREKELLKRLGNELVLRRKYRHFYFHATLTKDGLKHKGVNPAKVKGADEIRLVEENVNRKGLTYTTLSKYMNNVAFFFRKGLIEKMENGTFDIIEDQPSSGAQGLNGWSVLINGEWIELDNELSNL